MAATASAAVVGFLTSSAFGLSWANTSEAHSAQHVRTRIVIRLLQAAPRPLPSASRSRTIHSRNRRHLLYFRTRAKHRQKSKSAARAVSGSLEPSKPFVFSHLFRGERSSVS